MTTNSGTVATGSQKLFLVVASVLVSLLALEVGIRVLDLVRGYGFFSQRRNPLAAEISVIPFRTFGFQLYTEKDGERFISSRHGELFSIEKPSGALRIVVFGGSTTENEVSMREAQIHYPLVLQSLLEAGSDGREIEVINVANSAYATNHSLILFMLDVLSWEPDVVILSHNVNDLMASYWDGFTFDLSNKYSHAFYSPRPELERRYTSTNVLLQHSNLYWVLKGRLWPQGGGQPIERQSVGPVPLPIAQATFKRNLRSFVALARQDGILPVLGSQALLDTEDAFTRQMGAKIYNDEVVYPLHAEFVAHHRRYNEIIEEVARSAGVIFVDNNTPMDNVEEFFFDFVHYTPEGVEALASNYAQTILDAGVIEPR